MESRDALDDRESYAHTFLTLSASFIHSIEFFFHEINLIIRYPDTSVSKSKDIETIFFFIAACEECIFSCVFDKVREDIVKYLHIHITIHARHSITRKVDFYFLIIFLELWYIFCDYRESSRTDRKSLYMDMLECIASEMLIVHDATRDICETSEFSLEEGDSFFIELHNTIFYSIEIALHCCYRRTDLM